MSNTDLTSTTHNRPRVTRHLAIAASRQPQSCADREFAQAMIAYYVSSIKAAQFMREAGTDVLLLWLADSIITSHQRDLDMLRDWLGCCQDREGARADLSRETNDS